MIDRIRTLSAELFPEVVRLRRAIHRNPSRLASAIRV
jgi:hypothetical protein